MSDMPAGFDFTADLDKANIPADTYPATVKSVELRVAPKKDDPSITTVGLFVQTVIQSDFPIHQDFNGQYLSKYLWLGNGKMERFGLKNLKDFVDAVTGVENEGVFDWDSTGKVQRKDAEGNTRTYLTAYEGAPIGVRWAKNRKSDQMEIAGWVRYSDIEPVEVDADDIFERGV